MVSDEGRTPLQFFAVATSPYSTSAPDSGGVSVGASATARVHSATEGTAFASVDESFWCSKAVATSGGGYQTTKTYTDRVSL